MPSDLDDHARARLGTIINRKYRLERLIGSGGMASVYAAVHQNNGNRVAIKMLHPHLSIDADLRARFLREGYVANKVEHRGAVRVLDDDKTDDGSVVLVMELLEGETTRVSREAVASFRCAKCASSRFSFSTCSPRLTRRASSTETSNPRICF